MKKEIEADLISIAHRILQLKDHTTLPELQEEARQLYEKLAILNFAETHFKGPQPTIGQVYAAVEKLPEPEVSEQPEVATTPEIKEEASPQETVVTEENGIPFEEKIESPEEELAITEEPTPEKENGITYKEQNKQDKQDPSPEVVQTETEPENVIALFEEPIEKTLEDRPEDKP